MTEEKLIELFAAIQHEIWSHWMQYMFTQGATSPDTPVWVMPADKKERWQRQMNTPYANLTENEKASDRDQARKLMPVIDELRRLLDKWQSAAPHWHMPTERLPDMLLPVLAYWQEDGVWVAQFYSGEVPVYRNGATQPASGWYTIFDDSERPAPVCWCYPPAPAGMVCDMWEEMQP